MRNERLNNYLSKSKSDLIMGLVVAGTVAVVYLIVTAFAANSVNISYTLFFALAAFLLYFILKRIFKYLTVEKEGVIKKPK
jgi:hypothetical protein